MIRLVAFVLSALLSVGCFWILFSLRYEWHLNDTESFYFRLVIGTAVAAILACWIFFPSRLVVAAIGMAALCLPPFLDDGFTRLDPEFGRFLVAATLLLAGATHLRRGLRDWQRG